MTKKEKAKYKYITETRQIIECRNIKGINILTFSNAKIMKEQMFSLYKQLRLLKPQTKIQGDNKTTNLFDF